MFHALIGDAPIDLRQSRINVYHSRQILGLEPFAHGEHVFVDQFPGVQADDGGAEQLALLIADDLRHSRDFAFCLGPVHLLEGKGINLVRDAFRPGLGFR